MSLRVLAVAAPDRKFNPQGQLMTGSKDPVSLYNACREAARLAIEGIGPWGESNWAGDRKKRQSAIMLMRSLEEMAEFEEKLRTIRPNLLLIGAMSLCLPGAIACAQKAKANGQKKVQQLGLPSYGLSKAKCCK